MPARVIGRLLLAPVRRLSGAWRTARRSVALVPEALEAILTLPRLTGQLEVIAFQTATLAEMHGEIARMRGDTATLPQIERTLAQMAAVLERVDHNTAAVEQLAEIALPLQGAAVRMGRLADRWPAGRPALRQPRS